MRCGAVLLLVFFLCRLAAEEVGIEDDRTFGCAQFVEWDGMCGFLTPAHVFDALQPPFRIGGKPCRVLTVRRFEGRDLVFFTADAAGSAPLRVVPIPSRHDGGEFRLAGPETIDSDEWRGRSGTLGHDADGRPGLFIGLDRVTHERIFVRIDDLSP